MASKENKYVELHWLEGYQLDEPDENGVRSSHKKKFGYVAQSSTKRYYNCLYLLCKLSPCARNYMDYLCEVMDKDNMVSTGKTDKEAFIKFISKITKGDITYGDPAIKKAIGELKSKKLIKQTGIGRAKVNPLYFTNGTDSKRLEHIKLTIKVGSGKSDKDFKWVSEEVIPQSKLAKHRAINERYMEAEINI